MCSLLVKISLTISAILFHTAQSGIPDIIIRTGSYKDIQFCSDFYNEHKKETQNMLNPQNFFTVPHIQNIFAIEQGRIIGAIFFITCSKKKTISLKELQSYTPKKTKKSFANLLKKDSKPKAPKASKKNARILSLLVDKAKRNQGIGSRLLKNMRKEIGTNYPIHAKTEKKPVIQFFKKHGFTEQENNDWVLQD